MHNDVYLNLTSWITNVSAVLENTGTLGTTVLLQEISLLIIHKGYTSSISWNLSKCHSLQVPCTTHIILQVYGSFKTEQDSNTFHMTTAGCHMKGRLSILTTHKTRLLALPHLKPRIHFSKLETSILSSLFYC